MTLKSGIALILVNGLLGSFILAIPFPKNWVNFKNQDGKFVLINFDEVNSLGNERTEIKEDKVQFHLYTKKNPAESQRLFINDTNSLSSSHYNVNLSTKFIVHGFLNDLNGDVIQKLKDNFLSQNTEGYNVIGVDWSYYTSMYTDVLNKSKGVGYIIGKFLDFLITHGTKLENLHLIGHSLGAHVCGFAGGSIKSGKLPRITGLDPALPGFDVADPNERLDSQDALFVDCIHTCGGFLGIDDPICSADYYPNGGKDQPGCHWFDLGSCSHARSHEYFAESIIKGHKFPSLNCKSLNFHHEECKDKGALMGYPATQSNTGIFFTETNNAYPYSVNVTII